MNVLDLLRTRQTGRRMDAADVLADAAAAAAAGKTVDHGAVETALRETGQTLDQFEQLVRCATRREAWRKDAAKLDDARRKLAKAEATAAKERQQFDQVRDAWVVRARQLDNEIAAARKQVERGDLARGQLLDPDNALGGAGERLKAAQVARDEAAAAESEARKAVQIEQDHMDRHQRFADQKAQFGGTEHGDAEHHLRMKRQAANRQKAAKQEHVLAVAALDTAEQELAKAEQEALKR